MSYKQTKESFDRFLEECRLLAQNIALPLVPYVDCPACGDRALLDWDETEHVVEGNVYKGTHHFYRCPNCKDEFTTNESDGLSLATFELIKQPNSNE